MKTHWKKLTNPDYFGAYSLQQGEERVVEILSVSREQVTGADGKKDECTVAFLKGEKPLILNKTNCKTISKVLKTPFIEEWVGTKIILYSEPVKAFGEVVDAIRVKNATPTIPVLTPESKQWQGAVKALKGKTHTMTQLKTMFVLSSEHENLLIIESEQ